MPTRTFCSQLAISMPRNDTHVIAAMKKTPSAVTQNVLPARSSAPTR